MTATSAGLIEFQCIEEFGSDPVGVQGWPAGSYMFRDLKIIAGKTLSDRNGGNKSVIVGNTLATIKSLKVGQTLTISNLKFQIEGVFSARKTLITA